jgi:hypothetical protein
VALCGVTHPHDHHGDPVDGDRGGRGSISACNLIFFQENDGQGGAARGGIVMPGLRFEVPEDKQGSLWEDRVVPGTRCTGGYCAITPCRCFRSPSGNLRTAQPWEEGGGITVPIGGVWLSAIFSSARIRH